MLQRKSVIQFSLLLVVLATVLLLPWPGVESGYASLFRAGGNTFFSRFWFWSAGEVDFVNARSATLRLDIDVLTLGNLPASFEPPAPSDRQDTLLILKNTDKPAAGFGLLLTSSRIVGFWPTAWLLALVLAKPMSWSRRGWALLWGMLLVHLFIAVRLSLLIASKGLFMAEKKYAVYEMGAAGLRLLEGMEEVLVQNPSASFMVPTLIWFIVAFNRAEWARLRGEFGMGNEDRE